MSVQYNSSKLIPGPLINISKEYQKSGDGQSIGAVYTLTLQGTLVAYKGSPNSSGVFWTTSGEPPDETIDADSRLGAILKKQEGLRELFSENGHSFEIQPWDGNAPTKCNPEVVSIEFPQGIWFDRCEYTIVLRANKLIGPLSEGVDSFSDFISDANEEWSLEFNDQPESVESPQTFRLTHNISATGKLFYEVDGTIVRQPWEQAKTWVQARLGLDASKIRSTGAFNLPDYFTGFNHSRSESIGENNGQYSISETWIISSGNALEDFTVSVSTNTDDGLTRVSIDGNIVGLDSRDSNFALSSTKWLAASGKFTTIENSLLSRAQAYSQVSLNALPLSKVVRKNPFIGNIGYTVDYDNRPSNCIAGTLSESITVVDNNPADVFAIIPILGRAAGPILQNISTIREAKRDLSYECVVPVTGLCGVEILTAGRPDISSVISIVIPTATQVFKENDVENWSPRQGRYSRNITWVYQ